jgi:hypothetical protein
VVKLRIGFWGGVSCSSIKKCNYRYTSTGKRSKERREVKIWLLSSNVCNVQRMARSLEIFEESRRLWLEQVGTQGQERVDRLGGL